MSITPKEGPFSFKYFLDKNYVHYPSKIFYKEKLNIFIRLNIMKQIQRYIYCKIRNIHIPKHLQTAEQTERENRSTMSLLNFKTKTFLGYTKRKKISHPSHFFLVLIFC